MKKRDAQAHATSASTLVHWCSGAQTRLSIISPYFVPGDEVTARPRAYAAAGKYVRILTNSLAANDVAAVHGGYSRYRKTCSKAACSSGS